MKYLLLLIICCIPFCRIHAQQLPSPDYVVIKEGDTIYGDIEPKDYFNDAKPFKKIQITFNGQKRIFDPTQADEYVLDGVIFKSMQLGTVRWFMMLMASGHATLYFANTSGQVPLYAIIKDNNLTYGYNMKEVYKALDDEPDIKKNRWYLNPDYYTATDLVKEYNRWWSGNHPDD